MLRLQLGALASAGFSPDQVLDWTWDQMREWSQAIRQYHTDLAASLWTGKSPTATAARRWAGQQQARAELYANLRAQRPGVSEQDLRVLVSEDIKIQALKAAGIVVTTSSVAGPGSTPDLFKLAAQLRAEGAPTRPPGAGPVRPQGRQ